MEKLRYAAYARSATGKRSALDPQLHSIQQWASRQSINFTQVAYFAEIGSGEVFGLPEFYRMWDLAKTGSFDAVIVTEVNRLSREPAIAIFLERYFKRHNVRLFSVRDGEINTVGVNGVLEAIKRAQA